MMTSSHMHTATQILYFDTKSNRVCNDFFNTEVGFVKLNTKFIILLIRGKHSISLNSFWHIFEQTVHI